MLSDFESVKCGLLPVGILKAVSGQKSHPGLIPHSQEPLQQA